MSSKEYILEWVQYSEMDLKTANYLFENMFPKPLEIICYHCQQAVEKMLKALLITYGEKLQRTHDLGLLAEQLAEFVDISDKQIEMCDELTPYGVKIRYPQELFVEEYHVIKALDNANQLCQWLKGKIQYKIESL